MREQCFQLKTLQLLIDTCSFAHANLWPVSIFLNPASSNLTLTRVSKLKDFANKIAPAFMATLLKLLFAQQLPQRLHWIKTEFGPIRSFNASSQRSFTQSDRVLKKAYPFLELHTGTKALISPEDLYQFFIDVASPLAQMLFPLAESCLRVTAKTFSCANSQVTMLYDCLSNDAQGSAYGKGFAIIIIRFVVISSPQECIKWLKKDRMDKRMERVQKQRRPMRKKFWLSCIWIIKISVKIFWLVIIIEEITKMQSNNPMGVSNSELAQVEAQQKQIIKIFDSKFSQLQHRRDFYTNIHTIARFSIARQFKKDKVNEMWENWVKWYESFKPDTITQKQEIIHKIHASGKYRYCGVDKQGCPVLVIRMKYHVKGLATADQNLRYLLYMIEKGVALAKQAKTYQLSVIYDRRDMAESDDVSKESMKKFMPILNDYYPETLKSFYVLGANVLYRAAWKVVSIFISKRTEQKINLLEEPEKITEFIAAENLPIEYGGKLKIEQEGKIA